TRETPSDAGILKPDITAPGCVVASAISKDYSPSQSETADDGRHRVAQGTSMAAPHVTGALALYLRMDGALTPAKARNILRVYAVDDMYATGVPNNSWGYGKLNIQPGLAEFTAARNWNLFE
ncbi:MAG TPA: S8 family serine peptidase, partial [Candidatus Sumerlaeia bacterium]|nr:S8 family serine peptidase [Candidatus Sumerlaeia bacterium]